MKVLLELDESEANVLLAILDSFQNSEPGIKAAKASKKDRSHAYRDCYELTEKLSNQICSQTAKEGRDE